MVERSCDGMLDGIVVGGVVASAKSCAKILNG